MDVVEVTSRLPQGPGVALGGQASSAMEERQFLRESPDCGYHVNLDRGKLFEVSFDVSSRNIADDVRRNSSEPGARQRAAADPHLKPDARSYGGGIQTPGAQVVFLPGQACLLRPLPYPFLRSA